MASKNIKPALAKVAVAQLAEQAWLDSALGQYVQAQEQVLFDSAVSDVFGFNALQLGMANVDFLQNSRIPFALKAGAVVGDLRCDSEQLPFSANTVDLLLMPHVLDFSRHPQQSLREAERVLMPEGCLVITGFNPISSWGLRRVVSQRCPSSSRLWQSHFFSHLRIKDWLHLLGFEIVSTHMACHQLPFQSHAWLHRFEFLDKLGRRFWPMFGAVYCIVAKKRVVGMRVIKPNWKSAKMRPGFATRPSQKEEALKQVPKNN